MSRLSDELVRRQEMESQQKEAEIRRASIRKTRRMNGGMIAGICVAVGAIAIGTPLVMSAFASSQNVFDESNEVAPIIEDESPETVVTVESIEGDSLTSQDELQGELSQQQTNESPQEPALQGDAQSVAQGAEGALSQDSAQLEAQTPAEPVHQAEPAPAIGVAQGEQDGSSTEGLDSPAVSQQESDADSRTQVAPLEEPLAESSIIESDSTIPEINPEDEVAVAESAEPVLMAQSVNTSDKTAYEPNEPKLPTPRITVVNSLSVQMGKTANVAVRCPSGVKAVCSSGNEQIFKVSTGGKVTPVCPGTAKLTVYTLPNSSYSSATAHVKVTVTKGTPTLTVGAVPMNKMPTIGNSINLSVKTNSDGKVSYSSSRSYVASVSDKGKVKGIINGTTTITVSTPETRKWKATKKTIVITVKKKENPVRISGSYLTTRISYSDIQKKAMTVPSGISVISPKGITRYKNVSTDVKAKAFSISISNGKITIPKLTKKGRYTVKVEVTSPGNTLYTSKTQTVNCYIQIQ